MRYIDKARRMQPNVNSSKPKQPHIEMVDRQTHSWYRIGMIIIRGYRYAMLGWARLSTAEATFQAASLQCHWLLLRSSTAALNWDFPPCFGLEWIYLFSARSIFIKRVNPSYYSTSSPYVMVDLESLVVYQELLLGNSVLGLIHRAIHSSMRLPKDDRPACDW